MDPALRELIATSTRGEVEAVIRLAAPDSVPKSLRIVSQFGDIATCRLPLERITQTWADESVLSLKAARPFDQGEAPTFHRDAGDQDDAAADDAEIELQPSDIRRPDELPTTGRGTVVGVIDWGFDFAHDNFRNPDGSTRFLAIWDQAARSGPSPEPYGYGRVYTRQQINEALETDAPYSALDYHPGRADNKGRGAHGTHVLDIAAGNGRIEGSPLGLAPQAELLAVHLSTRGVEGVANLGDSVTLLEALDWIRQGAGDRPWVCNISVGRHGGPHTGLTLVEQGIDALVSEGPARCVVQSTGNYFAANAHASGHLRPGDSRTLRWRVDRADRTPNELEVWYPKTDVLAVDLTSPTGQSVNVALGDQAPIEIDGEVVGRFYHRASDPSRGDHHIDIFLYHGAPAGEWRLTLSGEDVVDGRFHCWVERDSSCPTCQSRFDPGDADPRSTTGTICNGYRSIAVGAYDAHDEKRPLARFSSSGPTVDGRFKPDLVAPGMRVLAARSTPQDSESASSRLVRNSGTSMATPHVTGTVANMFEAAGRPLAIQETRRLLLEVAEPASVDADAMRIGSGYLDVLAAVRATREYVREQATGLNRREMHEVDEPPKLPVAISSLPQAGGVAETSATSNDETRENDAMNESARTTGADDDAPAENLPQGFVVETGTLETRPTDAEAEWDDADDLIDAEPQDPDPALNATVEEAKCKCCREAGEFDDVFQEGEPSREYLVTSGDSTPPRAEDVESDGGQTQRGSNGSSWDFEDTGEDALIAFVERAVVKGELTDAESLLDAALEFHEREPLESLSGGPASAAELYDALAGVAGPAAERHFARYFDVVAGPGEPIEQRLLAGDVVLERALGEGSLVDAVLITDPGAFEVSFAERSRKGRRAGRRYRDRMRAIRPDPWARRRYGRLRRPVRRAFNQRPWPNNRMILRVRAPRRRLHRNAFSGRTSGERFAAPSVESSGKEFGAAESGNEFVKWVQRSLNRIMGLDLAVDGDAGPALRAAIRQFQAAHGLTADGIAGTQTTAAIREALRSLSAPAIPACPGIHIPEVLDDFLFDQSSLRAHHRPQVTGMARCVADSHATSEPIVSLRVVGHTDSVGSHAYNDALGLQRAEAVKQALLTEIHRLRPGAASAIDVETSTRGKRDAIPGSPARSRRVEVFLLVPEPGAGVSVSVGAVGTEMFDAEQAEQAGGRRTFTVAVGGDLRLVATGRPTPVGTPAYTWSSADVTVASVTQPGNNQQAHPNPAIVRGVSPGTTQVRVVYRTRSGRSATAEVDIVVVQARISELRDPTAAPAAGVNPLTRPRPAAADGVAHRIVVATFEPATFWNGKQAEWSFAPAGVTRGALPAAHSTNLEAAAGFDFDAATNRSTISATGEVSVRVNLPSVAFNRGQLTVRSVGSPRVQAAVDFEVPGIVVVDPGHGGNRRVGGSSPNNATSVSGVLEKDMTLDMGRRVRDVLTAHAAHQIEVVMTRDADVNVGIRARANVARDNGADVLTSIHFNGFHDPAVRGTVTIVRANANGNVNRAEDVGLAQRIQDALVAVIPNSRDRGVVDDTRTPHGSLGVLNDRSLGNTRRFHPNRACLVEVEFITNADVDALFNTNADHDRLRQQVAEAMADAIVDDLENQP